MCVCVCLYLSPLCVFPLNKNYKTECSVVYAVINYTTTLDKISLYMLSSVYLTLTPSTVFHVSPSDVLICFLSQPEFYHISG